MAEVLITSESIESSFASSPFNTGSPIGLDARTPAIEVALRDFEKGLPEPSPSLVKTSIDSVELPYTLTTESESNSIMRTRNEDYKGGEPQNQSQQEPQQTQPLLHTRSTDITPQPFQIDTALIKIYIEPDIFGSREITTRVDLDTIELYFLFPPKLSFSNRDGDLKYGDTFITLRKAHDIVVMDSMITLLKSPEYHKAKLVAYPSLKIVSMALYSKFARFYWEMLRDRIRILIKKHTPLLYSIRYYTTYTKKKLLDRNTYRSSSIILRDRFEREQIYLMRPLLEPASFRDHFYLLTQLEQRDFLSKSKIKMLRYLCVMFERNVEYFMHPMDCSKLPSRV